MGGGKHRLLARRLTGGRGWRGECCRRPDSQLMTGHTLPGALVTPEPLLIRRLCWLRGACGVSSGSATKWLLSWSGGGSPAVSLWTHTLAHLRASLRLQPAWACLLLDCPGCEQRGGRMAGGWGWGATEPEGATGSSKARAGEPENTS